MRAIEITPQKILKDAPFVFKIQSEEGRRSLETAQLIHSRGTAEVPLRFDKGHWIGELTLGQPGEYTLRVGSEKISFQVHEKEDLSFAAEFVFLAVCVGVLLIGLIRWDSKKKTKKAEAGSF